MYNDRILCTEADVIKFSWFVNVIGKYEFNRIPCIEQVSRTFYGNLKNEDSFVWN